jgi:hypothetical protein
MAYADDYVMSAFAYYEIGDLDSAQRCFRKADMTLMLFNDEYGESRKVFHFLHNFVQHKRGLGVAPTLNDLDPKWLLRTVLYNNDLPTLGRDLTSVFPTLGQAIA